jgi:hypothetical protein
MFMAIAGRAIAGLGSGGMVDLISVIVAGMNLDSQNALFL